MASRGVLFALTDEQRDGLLAAESDDAKIEYLQEEIEGAWDEDNLVETDKAWDAIHRALAREPKDSEELPGPSNDPLAQVILGGAPVLEDEGSYIIRLVEPSNLPAIAAVLKQISEADFRARYDAHCLGVEPEYDDDDGWQYTWSFFGSVRNFLIKVADRGRTVIFSVDL